MSDPYSHLRPIAAQLSRRWRTTEAEAFDFLLVYGTAARANEAMHCAWLLDKLPQDEANTQDEANKELAR